ncbi:stalk domain-containing protein [Paenibacillus sp. D51F]
MILTSIRRPALAVLAATILAAGGMGAGTAAAAGSAPSATILLDGYPLVFPAQPIIQNGTTMVPFRAIAEALQIPVEWNAAGKTVTAVKTTDEGQRKVVLRQGSKQATVDGEAAQLGAAPVQKSGTVLVPLSFFSSAFGAQVSWDGATRTVSIVSPPEKLYTKAYYAIKSYSQVKQLGRFDAVAFGWGRIGEDGRLTLKGKDFYWPQADGDVTPESIVAGAGAAGGHTEFMVFSGDVKGELTKMLGDSSLRADTVKGIVHAASQGGFKSIDLDFEGLGLTGDKAAAAQSFNVFVKELRAASKAAGLGLSLSLHPLNGSYKGYDYKTLSQLSDEIAIMAYDYEQGGKPEPLAKVDEAIRLALKETDRSKLLLGINFNSETAQTLSGPAGLAKRYGLKGIALWRLGPGLVDADSLAALERTVKLRGPAEG